MDYLEWLEHAKTLAEAWRRVDQNRPQGRPQLSLWAVINQEIQAERHRQDLALELAKDPFRCAQCGEVIMYGERQHVCRGAK